MEGMLLTEHDNCFFLAEKEVLIEKIDSVNERLNMLDELMHNGFKDELIERLLDTLEIRKKEVSVKKDKLFDWFIKLTLSGGLIYIIIEKMLS
jgi:Zn-dependent M16 (insulinase) family peptidase